ncbi:type I restriction endonuclease subunit M [Corynebacterium sp. HMSC22B11]|uniref:type I restriction-modification system subunit M n=1 Tax=Corynebacterium sp. HMSC22B11 TaxID=1581056 RepID=UPI0008A5F53F|nr:type I restriction-modification system subunit M [Corynebacterium sp. HMSC22B11]OFO14113.1 type I restriction endonuclease subunit M [Corynebacterium sp. HMSC22B11]
MDKRQLASRIWESANTMRSKIEAQEYKDYILGFIFYKFLSDQVEQLMYANDVEPDELAEVLVEDDPETVEFVQHRLGYFISYNNLHSTWRAAGSDFNVADVRDALAAFERLILPSRSHVFKDIFRTLETGLSKLGSSAVSQTKAIKDLLDLINDIPTDGAQGYDVLGFIYEYLISKFAANSGKKAGEFYTPHEVSEIMSRIVAAHTQDRETLTIYDPTSGSGSLLLNIGQAVARHMGDPDAIKYYAQELKDNTFNLTRMNLVMRGVKADNIVARNGDSLKHDWPMFDEADPKNTYDPLFVDAVVSNPPYSQKWEPEGMDTDPRFTQYGLAPQNKADYAFLLHELFHVKPDGIMTIVLPHGVLFRGGAEETIRTRLIEANNIDTIIGLPSSIFYGTGIPTIIMVLKKQRSHDDVLFIDASQGFIKDGKNNLLRARDIERIVDTVHARRDVEHFARVVSRDEIRDNDYNLNIPRYVSATLPPESVDFFATVNGGIPVSEIDALAEYWDVLPGLRETLFEEGANGYATLRTDDIREMVLEHSAAGTLADTLNATLDGFAGALETDLIDGAMAVPVNTAEDGIKADLFARLAPVPLVNEYQGYQLLHEKWLVIANDLTILQTEGWDAMRVIDPVMEWKTKDKKKVYVRTGWEGRVAPFAIVRSLYLPELAEKVVSLSGEAEDIKVQLNGLIEGLSEEDKLDVDEALNVKGDAFIKSGLEVVIANLSKSIQWPDGSMGAVLLRALDFMNRQTIVKKKIKESNPQSDALNELRDEAKTIKNGLRSLVDNLSDEDKREHVGLLNVKGDGFLKGGLEKTVNTLPMGMQWPEGSIESVVLEAYELVNRQSVVKTQLKDASEALESETREIIENLTPGQIEEVLNTKWIKALEGELELLPEYVLVKLASKVQRLQDKYATPLTELDTQIATTERSLLASLDQLAGSDADMQAVAALKQMLGGGQRD